MIKCPNCGREAAVSSSHKFYEEVREINGVLMKVLIVKDETYQCSGCATVWTDDTLQQRIEERVADMTKRFCLANAIKWLEKTSEGDFLLGEQNYARLLLKELGSKDEAFRQGMEFQSHAADRTVVG